MENLALDICNSIKSAEGALSQPEIQRAIVAALGELSIQRIITPENLADALVEACRLQRRPAAEPPPLPNIDMYNSFLLRGKDYATRVLLPGGMRADKGRTVTSKLKTCLLRMSGANDLKEITVRQWESIWAALDNAAKSGNENAVTFLEEIFSTCDRQTVSPEAAA